ncbi:MAG: hypothetical protein AAGF73_06290 [Actinomycetota bacterium]
MAAPAQYERTQTSYVGLLVLGAAFVVSLAIAAMGDGLSVQFVSLAVATFLLVGIVMAAMARLRVSVDDRRVEATFGWGWPTRVIELTDLRSASQVRNSWWYGWGIRWIPHGSMYNVWGRDAVELRLMNDRVFRIGTDDPAGLLAALQSGAACEPPR